MYQRSFFSSAYGNRLAIRDFHLTLSRRSVYTWWWRILTMPRTTFLSTAHMERIAHKTAVIKSKLQSALLYPREAYLKLRRECGYGADKARMLVNEWGKGLYKVDACLIPEPQQHPDTYAKRKTLYESLQSKALKVYHHKPHQPTTDISPSSKDKGAIVDGLHDHQKTLLQELREMSDVSASVDKGGGK